MTAELLICVKCRPEGSAEDEIRPGRRLYDALADAVPEGVRLRAVECLQNCNAGCTVALRGGTARWSYVVGNLSQDLAEVLRDGARLYAETPDGVIPWRQRPEHFKRNCVARIPPADFPDPLQEADQ